MFWILDRLPTILQTDAVLALLVFFTFVIVGYFVGRFNARFLHSIGVDTLVEGTTFERTAQGLGTSTVSVMARLSSWFIYGVGALVGLHILGVLDANLFWQQVTMFVPRLFVAILVVIVGIVVGEKAGLVVAERLRGVKFPEVSIIAGVAKYSVIFVAVLIALAQIGVTIAALLIILGAYSFGLVFLAGLAFKDLLLSGAAGIYLLLRQPYAIGDEIRINDRSGIVQEVTLFVTRLEDEEAEHVIPNWQLFRTGITIVH